MHVSYGFLLLHFLVKGARALRWVSRDLFIIETAKINDTSSVLCFGSVFALSVLVALTYEYTRKDAARSRLSRESFGVSSSFLSRILSLLSNTQM